ncbi:hypothetical protein ACFL5Z_06895 [Planctomycetota bacterium]
MTEDDKTNSQFERLKTSGQLVQKGNQWTWLPRTVAEYRELAETIIKCVQIEKDPPKKSIQFYDVPKKSRLFECAKRAFANAVWLVRWSRHSGTSSELEGTVLLADGHTVTYEICHSWIHRCCLLWAVSSELGRQYSWPSWYKEDTYHYPYYENDWPQSISSNAFDEFGNSTLHAMLSFAQRVYDFSFHIFMDTMSDNRDLEFEKAVVEPETCDQVRSWSEELTETLLKVMPYDEWPDKKVEEEEERLLCELEAEYQKAKRLPPIEPEIIEIDLNLFYKNPRNLLKELIVTPSGVRGTSQNAKNLRDVLRNKYDDEYKKAADHIHYEKREADTIFVDTKRIILKAK